MRLLRIAAFTLLPPENTTGNFVKVVQRVPVKIVFDEASANRGRLWAGESVEPRVKVRDNSAEPLPPAIVGAPDYTAAIAEQ
jgi:multidrug resistance efflux pump